VATLIASLRPFAPSARRGTVSPSSPRIGRVQPFTEQPGAPVIGRYVLRSKLGEGGMAEVYLAELRGSQGFRKQVVVKMLRAHHLGDPHQQDMFADEARVSSRIEHPNVPRTLELGDHEGRPYIVQEYVEGPSFDVVLRRARQRGGIDLRLGVRVAIDVARALDHAWRLEDRSGRPLRVVHRDVSPSNILVHRRGRAKLIDFGVARFADREAHTSTDVLKGKQRYLAPETIRDGSVSHASDLFAVGVVLFTATVGKAPWRATTDLGRRLRGEFDRPSELVPSYPPGLEAVVLRCLATDPADRYASGEALAVALEDWLVAEAGGPVGDEQVAAFVAELFPAGSADWLPSYDGDVASVGNTSETLTVAGAPRPPPPELWWIALGSVALLTGITGGLVLLLVMSRPTPPVAPAPVVDDAGAAARRDFEVLLRHADQALDRRQVGLAEQHLAALADVEVTDAAMQARREALVARVPRVVAVREILALARSDPDAAAQRAAALAEAHPGDPDVEALLAELTDEGK